MYTTGSFYRIFTYSGTKVWNFIYSVDVAVLTNIVLSRSPMTS